MLLKLSLRNIRRSVKDYAIYFVTLVFGVAAFYAFNSIGSQQILFDIESSAQTNIFDTMQTLMNGFSVVIAFVLGFLIVYANRFLIKRRKHEFGIYLTLGMNPGEISRIVLYETVIVSIASLAVGLACGILLAQALSFATAALFELKMAHYQFVFSAEAFGATIFSFAVIYVVVAVFNLLSAHRFKLIDLLSAHAKNETSPVRSPWLSLAGFVVAVGILAVAYWLLVQNGLLYVDDPRFAWATVLMLVGSLVFFWAVAGFAISVLQRLHGIYLKGLAMFTTRQIASKVNTAFVSLWAVCVLLFFSITTFSTGMGLIEVFWGEADEATPYDATLSAQVYYSSLEQLVHPGSGTYTTRSEGMQAEYPEQFADGTAYNWDMEAKMRDLIPTWDDFIADAAQIDGWEEPGVTYGDLCDQAGIELPNEIASVKSSNIGVASLSQINDNLALQGRAPVELGEDEYLIANNMAAADPLANGVHQAKMPLDIADRTLALKDGILDIQVQDNAMLATGCTFVVPDSVIDEMRDRGAIPLTSYLNVNYVTPGVEGDNALRTALAAAMPLDPGALAEGTALVNGTAHSDDTYQHMLWPVSNLVTAYDMEAQAGGLRMLITYLAVYIGFVFLIATAAILAIQQLSEAADSQPRYRLLARLGCDERMLNRSLFAQVIVYFLAPLALAACHCGCAISVMNGTLFSMFNISTGNALFMAAAFTMVVYGGYLVITYLVSRSIVKQAARG